MRTQIMHYGKRWRRADNHMDCRHCPDCAATVNGNHAQEMHQQWHLELVELFDDLFERAGIEPKEEVPWHAAVPDRTEELEAAE